MKIKYLSMFAACIIPTLAASANLITNGSFELPDNGSNFYLLYPNGTTIPGWTCMAGNLTDPQSDPECDITQTKPGLLAASDGKQMVDLAAAEGFDKGWQTTPINVVSGQAYTLTIDVGSWSIYPSNVGVSFNSGVWSDGTTAEKTFGNFTGPFYNGETNWQTFTMTWVASNTTSTQLSIYGRKPGATNTPTAIYNANIFVDNVTLAAAPSNEPTPAPTPTPKSTSTPIVDSQAVPQPSSSANLVTNGSFELPDNGSSFYLLYPNGSTIPGWTCMAGNLTDPQSDPECDIDQAMPGIVSASDGKQMTDLAAAEGFDKGWQTTPINVVSGQAYTLTI